MSRAGYQSGRGVTACRVCGAELPRRPWLRFAGMPKAAQYMPRKHELAHERGVDLEVFVCSGCGLVQLGSSPVPYYREVVRAAGISHEMEEYRLGQFGEFMRAYGLAGRRVIEVGCGAGEYLRLLQASGMEATGIEYGRKAWARCRADGLTAVRGFIDSPRRRVVRAPFAAFFMLNFLEHLPDPVSAMSGVAANLGPGAVGLVEVPNFDMILRRRLFSEFIGDHLLYFTRQTLTHTLVRSGLDVVDCRETWHDYTLSAVVRKRSGQPGGDLAAFQSTLTAEIRAFLARHRARRVAVWGAGHQALAVLALAKLGKRIRYVVDAAPFKQGCFTPATHLPVVAPAALDYDPVDAVLVMAGSYSDEVVQGLRGRPDLEIAVLEPQGVRVVGSPLALTRGRPGKRGAP